MTLLLFLIHYICLVTGGFSALTALIDKDLSLIDRIGLFFLGSVLWVFAVLSLTEIRGY